MKVALIILFAALTIVSAKQVAVDAPPAKSGKIPPGARNKRATCGSPTKLNADQCAESITAHNLFRSREPAANIRKIVWSDAMAARAQEWADTCTWAHGMLNDCSGNRIGQNLYLECNPNGYPPVNGTGVAEAWWLERNDYTFDTKACTPGKLCGHYTQLTAAYSYEAGCGVAFCPSVAMPGGATWKNCVLYACDYNPPGNVIGEDLYQKGTPCSNCDSEGTGAGYKCENNLCAKCTPATDAACKCGTPLACANGSWSASTCSCTCNKGFYGLKCEKSCTCVDSKAIDCDAYKVYCDEADYVGFMTDNCPVTCPKLCKPPPAQFCA